MLRFTLYGSPHSPATYKVALMLRLSGEPFSFRYVSFQKGMHRAPEFLALSRWGQVPVLTDGERVHLQSAAILEHLAISLARFSAPDPATRQAVREWLYWAVDTLAPPILGCYGVRLGEKGLLPIHMDPAIAGARKQRSAPWTPFSLKIDISTLPDPPLPIYFATAMWRLQRLAHST